MTRLLIALSFLLMSAQIAHAAVCTATIPGLDFGPVDTIGNAAVDATADVVISCEGVTPGTTTITACANLGPGSGGVVDGIRQSIAGDGHLGFLLYTDAGHVEAWGTITDPELGQPRRIDMPVTGTTATRTVRLYGLIPGGQATVPVGDYRADFAPLDATLTYAEGDLDCAHPVGGTDAHIPFAVSAQVVADCMLDTSDLDFGTAGAIGDNIDASTNFEVTCTPGSAFTIALDGGQSGATDPTRRLLRAGANTVTYGLYSNNARNAPWGSGVGSTISGSADGTQQTISVYGRIPPQSAAPGAYTDTVVVTMTY